MRIPNQALQSVIFLCGKESGGQLRYGGTAFFITFPSERYPERHYRYLVTAKHCVELIRATFGGLFARVNLKDGSSEVVDFPEQWYYHPDEAMDVAVLPIFPPSEIDYTAMPRSIFMTDEAKGEYGIGVGDELFLVGLFANHHGMKANVPVARSGIISAMPGEAIQDEASGLDYTAYLAEIKSIGGLSGSPVFAYIGVDRILEGDARPYTKTKIFLLGLIRGHWPKAGVWLSDLENDEQAVLNTGIAIVTPIQAVLDILEGEELTKHRKDTDTQIDRNEAQAEDAATASPSA